ncbi:hypothetical protein TrVE_jg9628 [Triparma verrucosa]|uniref:VWFA domain-containing protein n=1 Tax=Triparma verrucosa TaxID=1606542 RepID=A0A9W7FJP6_9STRA|nr:hypothetical protein TrVE_jg9628 [Triparma verrucosa]
MSFINSIARRLSGAGMEESDGFVVVPPTLPQTDSAPSAPTISLSLKQKHSSIGLKHPNVKSNSYVASLTAASVVNEEERAPLDIAVVMDISGSMSGGKLNLCKKTCLVLLNELKATDRFSLVTFGDDAKVEFSLAGLTASNKVNAENKVKALRTNGCTNLSGGMTAGIQELQSATAPNAVRSVLLLTDGHANRGVSAPAGIISLLKGCLASESSANISVNTFGYGEDHNAELLKGISEGSSTPGSYYFIETEDNVSSAFGDCIGGLLSVAAQNIKIKIRETTGAQLEVSDQRAVRTTPSSFTLQIGDILADETKDFLIECSNFTGETACIEVQVEYVDIVNSRPAISPVESITTVLPDDATISEVDTYVALQALRVLVANTLRSAGTQARARNITQARESVQSTITKITEESTALTLTPTDQVIVTSLLKDLNDCLSGMTTYHEYEQRGSKMMSMKAQMHTYQRCNESDETSFNMYRGTTSSKAVYARKLKGASNAY